MIEFVPLVTPKKAQILHYISWDLGLGVTRNNLLTLCYRRPFLVGLSGTLPGNGDAILDVSVLAPVSIRITGIQTTPPIPHAAHSNSTY